MRATVLSDNIPFENFEEEWGLSVYIEYKGRRILLDAGASDLFIRNGKKLGIDVSDVEYAVLSHAHWDHADGMPYFFESNKTAAFYLQSCCGENCYSEKEEGMDYIGIPKGMQEKYSDRLKYVDGKIELVEGVYIMGHTTPGLEKCGVESHMYTENEGEFTPDDFAHEQSLVFDTEKGLVIFNSCSHAGADNIINEVSAEFPGKALYAMIGGFHLFEKSEEYVVEFAERMRKTGIKHIYTGHCTGEMQLEVLKRELGDCVKGFHAGLVMEF